MHRSVTLSEIVSSTCTNNVDEVDNSRSRKDRFVVKIGVGLVEFLVSSLYQCYGILLAQYVEFGEYPLEKAAWTTFIYLAAWNLTAPWSKLLIEQLEQRNHFPYKIVMAISTLLLGVGMVIPPHFLCYGIFGGTFSSIIYTQLKHLVRNKYRNTERSFEGNIQSARAISLLIMPHVVLLLVENYIMTNVTMIYAAIMLHVIPAALVLRLPRRRYPDSMPALDRYQTLPAFSQQMKEMKVFASSVNTSDIKHSDTVSMNDESSEDSESENEGEKNEEIDDLLIQEENMTSYDQTNEGYLPPAPLTPTSVQLYYSHAGVSILPKIPEEADEIDETDINLIDPKRLSRISTALEELNRTERKEMIKETVITTEILMKPEPIDNIEYISNYNDKKNRFLKDMQFVTKRPCCSCSPYNLFLWKRRMRSWKDFLTDYLLIPLFRSLSNLHFYPILASKVSIMLSSNFYITLTPYITLKKNDVYRREDIAFLLSYIAFSWCLSLVLLPLLMKFSATRLRATFVVGLVLSSCSMLLLTKRKMSNDFITWSCLLFGFGYGLSRFTENLVYRTFAGKGKFAQFEAILNTLTGVFVILIYYLIYIYDVDLVAVFPLVAAICFFVNALVWVVVPFLKKIIIFLKKYYRKRSDSSSIL